METQRDEIKEENVEMDKIEIGEDKPQIESKKVVIVDYRIEPITKEKKEIGKKLILLVDHPDMVEKTIEISGVKYQQGEKIKQSGLWVNLDKDKKIPYKSAVATMLRHFKCSQIINLKGVEAETALDDGGYLLIKAY